MKNTITILTILLFAPMLVYAAGFDGTPTGGELTPMPDTLQVQNGKIAGVTSLRSLNFVSLNTNEIYAYEAKFRSQHGPFLWDTSRNVLSGAQCPIDDYIAYTFESGSREGKFIFDQLWLKTSTNDLPNFLNYYTNGETWYTDVPFEYSYSCWEITGQTTDDTFEQGCLTGDKKACVSVSDDRCVTDYTYQAQCLQHIQSDTGDTTSDNTDSGDTGSGSTSQGDDPSVVKQPVTFKSYMIQAGGEDVKGAENPQIALGDNVKVTAVVSAPVSGSYWLEMGSDNFAGLAQVDISGNSCDPGELWFANKKVTLDEGDNTVSFSINPQEGKNSLWLAQITGCGGDIVGELYPLDETILVGSGKTNAGQVLDNITSDPTALLIVGIILVVIGVIVYNRR